MKKLLHLSFTLFFLGLSQCIFAQCTDITCPDDIDVELFDPCDESSPEIENVTGYPYDNSGSAPFIDGTDFDAVPGSPGQDPSCDQTEQYSYEDGNIDFSFDCAGDGYFATFIRTWTVYDAVGSFLDDCEQTITLIDLTPPMSQIGDLVDFFESQDPLGNNWDNTVLECPDSGGWQEPDLGVDITDNCSPGNGIFMTSNIAPFDQLQDGLNVIEYTIMDGCGNVMDVIEWDIMVTCIVPCMGAPIFEDCTDPPIECDLNTINGFMSCTPDYNGGTFGDLCNGQGAIHNASYFSFVAGSEDIGITVGVSDCLGTGNGTGVQANIIDPCDPNTCYGDSGANCQTTQFSFNATGLTIGNVYQLVVDGCNGDECAYSVSIDSAPPFEIPEPEAEIAIVEDPPSCDLDINNIIVCPGTVVTFFPENFEDAEFFFCWDISNPNGANAVNNDTDCTVALTGTTFACTSQYSTCGPLELEFTQEGAYEVCLTQMNNGCDDNQPNNYCYNVNVVLAVDQDWGSFDVCEVELPFFNVPDNPNTGEAWMGAQGSSLVAGMNTFDVEDDCDCNYTQMMNLNVLPIDDIDPLEYSVCANSATTWVDPVYGVDWDYVSSFGPGPNLFENVLIEGGSQQIDFENQNCDINVTYLFDIYDIPGSIMQMNGSACDVNLSFDIDDASFPPFMDESDIGFSWADAAGNVVGLASSVNVTMEGAYTLTMNYFVPGGGGTCTFEYTTTVSLSGSTPGQPSFISNPTATCAGMTTGLMYSVTPSAGSTFTWTATNGNITSGAGTDAITVDVIDDTMPMTIMVFAETPGCGQSPAATTTLNITTGPELTLDQPMDACVGETIMIGSTITAGSASTFNWTVGTDATVPGFTGNLATLPISWSTPGMKTVSLAVEDAGGCESSTVEIMVNVVGALTPPVATCTVENSTTVTIEWTDIIPGETTVTSSIPGTQTGSSYTVDGLTSGTMVTFSLITNGATHPCGDSPASTVICETSNCNVSPTISVDPEYDDFCLDGSVGPVQIASTPAGGTWSGDGVDANGMFDPSQVAPGTVTIMYEYFDPAQNCSGSTSLTMTAYENPDPTFTLSTDAACIGEPITIIYAGIPGSATNWDYGQGASAPMNIMPNQFDISYNTGGQKIINLEVSNGECMRMSDLPVQIYPALAAPVLTCNPTTNTVDVSWDEITGVTMYDIEITTPTGTTNTSQSTTTIPVDGLNAGDDVTVTVTAIDPNGCQNATSTCMTTAQDCPIYTVAIDDVPGECWDAANPAVIALTVTVTDENGADVTTAGTGVWSGPGIMDPMTGIFMPPGPNGVPYTIAYTYTDATGCPGVSTVDVSIFDEPNSAFATDVDDLCVGDELTVIVDNYVTGGNYDLILGADASTYTQTDNSDGTFTIVFSDDPGGDVDVSLQLNVGTCSSPLEETTVTVLAPLEFSIMDLVECYNVDTPIELEALDLNGDLVAGQWEVENEGLLPGTTFTPTINNTIYTLTFTEENCGQQETITVEVIEKPTLSISPLTQTVCIDETINVTIESNFYTEIMHTGLNGTSDVPPLNALSPPDFELIFPGPGTYTYESVIDRPGDCDSDMIEWEVIVEGPPEMPVMNPCVQTLNSVEFSWTTVPCAENYTIIYDGPDGEVIVGDTDDTSILIEDLAQGDIIDITISINSNCGCEFPDALSMSCSAEDCEPATITFGNELESEYCMSDPPAPFQMTADVTGDEIDLSGDFTYSGDGVDAGGMVDVSGLSAGDYSIRVDYEEDGCSYSENISYAILASPQVTIDIDNAPCPESTEGVVNFAGIGTGPFDFSVGGEAFNEGENNIEIGTYTVIVTDGNGCTAEQSFDVEQDAAPTATLDVPGDVFTEQLQSFSFDLSTSPDSVIWTIGDTIVMEIDCALSDCLNFDFTPTQEITYEVCVEAFYGGCTITECREMEADEFTINSIYIPNVFNPGNPTDPTNQNLDLYIEGYDLVVKDFSLFDRWGNVVHRDDTDKPGSDESIITLWDGTFNGGTDFVPGVYVYVVELLIMEGDDRERTEFKTGSVTVVD